MNPPDIRARLVETIRMFNATAALVADRAARGNAPAGDDDLYERLVNVLRRVDETLFLSDAAGMGGHAEWGDVLAMAQAARYAVYLTLAAAFPEEAAYWSPDSQAHIRAVDAALTPEAREQLYREALEDDARLREDPDAWAALRDELALWDTTAADGIGAE